MSIVISGDVMEMAGIFMVLSTHRFCRAIPKQKLFTCGRDALQVTRSKGAIHGLPRMVVTDNGTPFSEEFKSFINRNGIRHSRQHFCSCAIEILEKRFGRPKMVGALLGLVEGIDYDYEFVTGRIRRTTSGVFLMKGEDPDDMSLRKFWEIQLLGIVPVEDMAADGAVALKKFEETLCLDGRGYRVSLP
ncbi:hypothetical protein T4B_2797 [Trichinella pseudospiralis]|uniref:Integrase catalytic domain-containing protein n=1 Tax=Trichinella pseudospiralis TaxID=6337 RepID=A0A0V1JAP6_TRIPS|nr:hypothetical protein T4B_2797 [Trichinella pseudospiralis]